MKFIQNVFESIKPNFDKGGKFEKLWPFYDGFYTFFFIPGHPTEKGAHIRDASNMKRTMGMVIFALLPCLLFGIWNTGHQHFLAVGESVSFFDKVLFGAIKVIPIIIVAYTVGLGVEFAFCIIKSHPINEGFLVSGMLIPLIMPVDIPLWMVAVATVFAVVIGKEVFGGTGMNILNPALTARAFLFFAYPTKMSGDQVWVNTSIEEGQSLIDGYTGATPLGNAVEGGVNAIPSLMESIVGIIPGSIGETSVIAIGLGALILLFTGVGNWRIMIATFVGGYLMGTIFNLVGGSPYLEVPALHQLMLGGFAFGAVFMATDPVTATQTNVGKYFYGLLIGFLAILIRVGNPAYPEGMMLAILIANVFAPLIDHIVVGLNIKRRLNRLKTV